MSVKPNCNIRVSPRIKVKYMDEKELSAWREQKTLSFTSLPNVGPYMYVSGDKKKKVRLDGKVRTFRILLYGAYNAMGLIGSECNGIAVLDEDNMNVVADEVAIAGSGWGGPNGHQIMVYNTLCAAGPKSFRIYVNGFKRLRYSI